MDDERAELRARNPVRGARLTGVSLLLLMWSIGVAFRVSPAQEAAHASLLRRVPAPELLAREVLDALRRHDPVRLDGLALTEDEFARVVWPYLPASRPDVGLPLQYAWQDLAAKSRAHGQRVLATLGGRQLELVGIAFTGETTDYGSFRVRRRSVVTVRDESGETKGIRVFGSMIEYAGRVKVFSYVTD